MSPSPNHNLLKWLRRTRAGMVSGVSTQFEAPDLFHTQIQDEGSVSGKASEKSSGAIDGRSLLKYVVNALPTTVLALSKTVCQLQLLKNRSINETSEGGEGNTKGTRARGILYRAGSRVGTAARGLRTCVPGGMRWPTAAAECETCVTQRCVARSRRPVVHRSHGVDGDA